jgi:methyltransferase-like protein
MFCSTFEPEVEHFLEGLGSLEEQEQYMDFLRVRTLRQSLVCRRSIEPEYSIDLSCLDNFACYSELKPQKQVNLRRQGEDIFFAQEKRVPISDPVIKATLMHLSEVHPDAIALPELYALAKARLQATEVRAGVTEYADWQQSIFNLLAHNLIGMHPSERHFPRVTTQLQLSPLARLQAVTGNITTVWHQNLTLDAFAIRMVELLDGRRGMDEVVMLLKQDCDSGRLDLGPRPSIDAIKKNCNRLLALFEHHGLMCAGRDFVAETA